MTAYRDWDLDAARREAEPFTALDGGLLPALHKVQSLFGFIPEEARDLLADLFNLSRAEVLGVVHFYDDFRDSLPEGKLLKICMGEACQAVGAESLMEEASARQGWQVEEVFCLGNCACGPSAMKEEQVIGRATMAGLDAMMGQEGGEP